MRALKLKVAITGIVALMFGVVCGVHAEERSLTVTMAPTKRAQIAVWIETEDGRYLQTLGLTQAVSRRGIGNRPGASQMNSGFRWPYGRREGVLPVWAHRRAGAEGAMQFKRVIFQSRVEGLASRTASDFSRDPYYCLSFNNATTQRDALDAVSCASVFNSDKGRFITEADLALNYAEPGESAPGVGEMKVLGATSLYPPRRDLTRCTDGGCFDHPDVSAYDAHSLSVMPELDAITMATPADAVQTNITFNVPEDWPNGNYVVWVEVNTEGDYNEAYGPAQYPTPRQPTNMWDYWATSYGYPYRGQPSVVYRMPVVLDGGSFVATESKAVGYGSLSGSDGNLRAMDSSISRLDQDGMPGSGEDRLYADNEGARLRVVSLGAEACRQDTSPTDPKEVTVAPYSERRHAHEWAQLSFLASGDNLGILQYVVRISSEPITDEASFERAIPVQAASLDSIALMVSPSVPEGQSVSVGIGGLQPESRYYLGVQAVDRCGKKSNITTTTFETLSIEFTTVSPCFIATAAYGSPWAGEVNVLRRFRDRVLMPRAWGRAFVRLYYRLSPPLADQVAKRVWLKTSVRVLLNPVVRVLSWLEDRVKRLD